MRLKEETLIFCLLFAAFNARIYAAEPAEGGARNAKLIAEVEQENQKLSPTSVRLPASETQQTTNSSKENE